MRTQQADSGKLHAPSRAAAAGAATAAAATTANRPRRVAVVGAGVAGLAAALALKRAGGCEVVVLEAGTRAGGRAYTQRDGLPSGLAFEQGETTRLPQSRF